MVFEYRVGWNVGGANPGVTVFHGRNDGVISDQDTIEELAARARAFFDAVKGLVPGAVTWTFPGEGIEMNTSTGVLEDVYTFAPPASVTGTGAGNYGWPAGARVEWRTPAIVSGRRLRGRTFLVPITTNAMEANGTLSAGTITTMTNAANTFFSQSVFTDCAPCIWSRTHGILADITSALVPDEVAIMRSRRD